MLATSLVWFAALRPTVRMGPARWLGPSALRAPGPLAARMSSAAGGPTVTSLCQDKIKAGLNAQQVEVQGAYDDPNGSHITIFAVASAFEGKSALQRQQLVYKQIWAELQGPVHAVDKMILKTPAELAAGK